VITPLRFQFVLTPKVLRDVEQTLSEHGVFDSNLKSEQARNHRRELLLAPLWFFAIVGVVAILSEGFGAPGWDGTVVALVIAFLVAGGRLAAAADLRKSRQKLLRRFKQNRVYELTNSGPMTVILTERGITRSGRLVEESMEWPIVARADLLGDYLAVFSFSQQLVVIPVSALPSGVSAAEVLEGIRRRLKASGGKVESVRRYLAYAERECPGCGYPLKDMPEPRCPECGREFRFEDV